MLTDWLRSDWLETYLIATSNDTILMAYRLASIGLVGNLRRVYCTDMNSFRAYRLASIGLVGNDSDLESTGAPFNGLPIGFDRISWKLELGRS